jgi:hypothetical protein
MDETIRQHIKRRARLSMLILLCYFVLMIGLLAIGRNQSWVGPLVGIVFITMAVSLIWAAWLRCPRCGVSLDTPWDQPRVSE